MAPPNGRKLISLFEHGEPADVTLTKYLREELAHAPTQVSSTGGIRTVNGDLKRPKKLHSRVRKKKKDRDTFEVAAKKNNTEGVKLVGRTEIGVSARIGTKTPGEPKQRGTFQEQEETPQTVVPYPS